MSGAPLAPPRTARPRTVIAAADALAPDVRHYLAAQSAAPDAVLVAMRHVAGQHGLELPHPETAALVGLLVRMHQPRRLLELGGGIGYVTLHLARAAGRACEVTSFERDPLLQEAAHAFLHRADPDCTVELRLGSGLQLRREDPATRFDMLVATRSESGCLDLVDRFVTLLSSGALLVMIDTWPERAELAALGRDPRLRDVTLLHAGRGVLVATRA